MGFDPTHQPAEQEEPLKATRERFRKMLEEGKLEDREVEADVKERAANVMIGMPQGADWRKWGLISRK